MAKQVNIVRQEIDKSAHHILNGQHRYSGLRGVSVVSLDADIDQSRLEGLIRGYEMAKTEGLTFVKSYNGFIETFNVDGCPAFKVGQVGTSLELSYITPEVDMHVTIPKEIMDKMIDIATIRRDD